ncbi:MAG TPA: SDR family NAD(P)-dependent oxidoreductase [Rhodopila sp.]|uniref:type I polyketide synthase n=1 Tax=Rhodopila sp. TaxID=2480087 RepID=UPI002C6D3454|nr:SDR family NAD(P)-dependent oxidoreductase [Rhodopila sp.]HVY16790.1 SDR family NAD(P)-dependent oxidoreductase [Rhodopila sp.]
MMENFLDRIGKLPPKKLALLAAELYERSRAGNGAAEPIAVTAMACRFPGGSETPEAFWSFLERGGDAIQRAPEARLAMTRSPIEEINELGPIWGGFLKQVDEFDPSVFGISPKEAELMDPQQRLLLETCWEALENTGTPIDALDPETGVFIGVSGFDFSMIGLDSDMELNGYMLTGAAHSVIAGRLSYIFGLNGPSTVMDTACAAAASAIHLACQSLRANECDQALAGGINLLLMPEVAHMLGSMQVMAKDGRCKAFSADADGFVRAEGCGVIVLRRLSDAMASGEPILGVIRGSAWNQDGKSGGLTAPNGAAQEKVIKAALANARVSPNDVSYVEAHGTGTALGDPIELSALARVFGTEQREEPLIVGSVKTNIGHLEAAAGMPGIIKVLLALRHETIPRHLHAETLSPRFDWDKLPLRVPRQAVAWPKADKPRIAGVSAFGISGTNVHLVVSEPPPRVEPEPGRARSRTLLTLSAKSKAALAALAGRHADLLAERPETDIAALAAAANLKRAHFPHRLALVTASAADAERELRRFSQGDANSRVRAAFVAQHRPPRVGMLFGDAPADRGLIVRLHETEPVFRAAYDAWIAAQPGRAAGGALSAAATKVGFQLALCGLWKSWGISPALAAGDGAGEIAAALAVSGLSPDDAAVLLDTGDGRGVVARPVTVPLLVGSCQETVGVGQSLPAGGLAAIGSGHGVRERTKGLADQMVALSVVDDEGLLGELAYVYLAGATVNWHAFHAGDRPDSIDLPNYPFQRARYWPAEWRKRIGRNETAQQVPAAEKGLYRVEWRPAESAPPAGVTVGPVLVLHRDPTAAQAARAALEAAGLRVEDRPVVNGALTRPDLEALVAGHLGKAWLYVPALGAGIADPAGASRVALEDLLAIVQVLMDQGPSAPALYVATTGAQPAGGVASPALAPLWGLGRVLVSEAPDLRATLIDLDAAAPDWKGVAAVIAGGRGEAELALVDGQVLTPTLTQAELPERPDGTLASHEGSYIVTGAFGFIGDLTSRWLVKQGAGKLFLVGRNPPKAEALAGIEAARAAGTEIEVVVADIGTQGGVEAVFARVEADSRPLKGIIHSAGALDDAAISRQTPASLAHAFGAKAVGAWLLHQRSRAHALDFFVLYSSAAALLGTPGQSNYAAANIYLDALAHHRRAQGLTALSLNWGLWTSTGLAVKREVVQSGASTGAIPITPEHGMAVLEQAIASGETQVAVLPLDWPLVRKTIGSRRPPTLMKALLMTAPPGDSTGVVETGAVTLLAEYTQSFAAAVGTERHGVLVAFARRRAGELLNLDPASPLPDDQPLLDLGLDSLVGLELKNDLQSVSGMTFPSTLFFDCPTMADLTRYFELMLPQGEPAGSGATQEHERILL